MIRREVINEQCAIAVKGLVKTFTYWWIRDMDQYKCLDAINDIIKYNLHCDDILLS